MANVARTRTSWILFTRGILLLVGWVAGIAGTAYAINGATHPPFAPVKVPVTLSDGLGSGAVALAMSGADVPHDTLVGIAHSRAFIIEAAIDADRLDQFLARADTLVLGIGILVGAYLLAPVLQSIAEGNPFGGRHSRRIALLAAVIAACGVVGPGLAQWQGRVALQRLGLDRLTSPEGMPYFVTGFSPTPAPILVAAVVLAVAAAFRAGERLASDVEGLV